jgi:flagellar motor protein MotB
MEIARAIEMRPASEASRRFLVTANVDEEPKKSKTYESSWDLTVARSVTVVKYLISVGVPSGSLVAAGAGAFDPLVPGESADAKARNRRVEIALFPTAEETPPQAAPTPQAVK